MEKLITHRNTYVNRISLKITYTLINFNSEFRFSIIETRGSVTC
jgi:hypothetical protein